MSPLRIVGLLALVAMIGAVSCANDNSCTPSTCGAGPVIISFSSTDCSGSGTFTNFANDDPSTFGSCVRDGSNDFYRIEVTNDFVAYTEVNNPSCDVTLANATYYVELYYFGKCRPRNNMARGAKDMNAATSSWMVLPNVNATYTSPQPAPVVNMNYPNIYVDIYSAPCVSTTNCTAENGQDPTFIAYNTQSDSCTPANAYGTYNNSYDGRTCYRVSDLHYATYHCVDEHAYATLYYLDSACQNVFSAEYNRRVCVPNVYSSYYSCLATPTPLAPFASPSATPSAVPTSEATSIHSSFLLLIASVMALLF